MATDVSYFEVEGDSTLYQFNDPDAETALTALNQRLQTAEGNITTLQDDVTTLDENVTDVQGDVATLQGDVSTAQGDISTLQGDVGTAQGDITDLQGDVAELRTLPATQTSGNWTWWEFDSGLIVAKAAFQTSAFQVTASGNVYRTLSAVQFGPTPFSFSSGSFNGLMTQNCWMGAPIITPPNSISSYVFRSTSSSDPIAPNAYIIFVGQK